MGNSWMLSLKCKLSRHVCNRIVDEWKQEKWTNRVAAHLEYAGRRGQTVFRMGTTIHNANNRLYFILITYVYHIFLPNIFLWIFHWERDGARMKAYDCCISWWELWWADHTFSLTDHRAVSKWHRKIFLGTEIITILGASLDLFSK